MPQTFFYYATSTIAMYNVDISNKSDSQYSSQIGKDHAYAGSIYEYTRKARYARSETGIFPFCPLREVCSKMVLPHVAPGGTIMCTRLCGRKQTASISRTLLINVIFRATFGANFFYTGHEN